MSLKLRYNYLKVLWSDYMLLTFNISLDLFAQLINSVLASANQDIHRSFEVQILPFAWQRPV